MKIAALIAAATLVTSTALAVDGGKTPWSCTVGWDFKTHQPASLVLHTMKTKKITDKLRFSIVGFGGTTIQASAKTSQGMVLGSGPDFTYDISKNTAITAGVGYGVFAGGSPHFLVFTSISLKF